VLSFTISGLEKDKFYCLQVVGKKQTSLGDLTFNQPREVEPYFAKAGVENLLLGGRNVLYSDIITRKSLPGNTIRHPEEIVVYHYYFKTSKYNTFREKWVGKGWSPTLHSGFGIERFSTQTSLDEGLERYDRDGFKKGNKSTVPPLIVLTVNDGTVPGFSHDNSYSGYPLNSYIGEKVIPMIRQPISKTNKVLTKSYIDEQVEYTLASYKTAIEWGEDMTFQSPVSTAEMNLVNNAPEAESGLNFGNANLGGATSGLPSGFGNTGIFLNGLDNSSSGQKVEVFDNMPIYGRLNFNRAKMEMARALAVELPLFDKNRLPKYYNLYPDPEFWVHKYLGWPEIDANKWNKYADRFKNGNPTICDFLFSFYPQEGFMAYALSTFSPNYMNPPGENSFILQYQFPSPYIVDHTASTHKGTHFRVTYSK